jgi:hypothetical protein
MLVFVAKASRGFDELEDYKKKLHYDEEDNAAADDDFDNNDDDNEDDDATIENITNTSFSN